MASRAAKGAANKLAKAYELRWFALGYYDGVNDNFDHTPSVEISDYLKEIANLDVGALYQRGWNVGRKDQKEGHL